MKVDVSQEIKALNGEVFKDGDQALTLKSLCVMALMRPDENIQGSEKIERNSIAEKIWAAEKEVDLKLSELGKIRNILDRPNGFHTRVVAVGLQMLEGEKDVVH